MSGGPPSSPPSGPAQGPPSGPTQNPSETPPRGGVNRPKSRSKPRCLVAHRDLEGGTT